MDTVMLKTPYMPMPIPVAGKLELMPDPTPETAGRQECVADS